MVSGGRGEEKRWTAELKSRQRCPQTGAKTKHPHTHKCFKAHNANFRQVTLCAKQATLTRPLHIVTMAISEQRAARKLQLESWPKKNKAKKVERNKKKMKYNFNGTKHKSWKCLWCWVLLLLLLWQQQLLLLLLLLLSVAAAASDVISLVPPRDSNIF